MKNITIESIKDLDPCKDGLDNLIKHHPNFNGTSIEFCDLDNIPLEDKQWLLLREEYLPINALYLYGCFCADEVLDIFEKEYPKDKRPRKAIEAKRLFLEGKISSEVLGVARDAASCASYTARDAASVASYTARDAASVAIYTASDARDAARDAANSASYAARYAASVTARYAARDAARYASYTARDARDAARDAANSARYAARYAVIKENQLIELKRILRGME